MTKKQRYNFSFNRVSQKKGVALLFSVMLSTIFLTIAISVLNIAVKELNFSSSAKDTNNAFFAADSGIECALYHDRSDKSVFIVGGQPQIICFGLPPVTIVGTTGEGVSPNFKFNLPGLGSNNNSCVKVDITKVVNSTTGITSTTIISKGYNIASDNDCNSTVRNRVERVIEVNY